MKKILLFGFSICASSMAFSQNIDKIKSLKEPLSDPKVIMQRSASDKALIDRVNNTKSIRSLTGRYYSFINGLDSLSKNNGGNGLGNNSAFTLMWQDSTIRQSFSSGLGTVNWRMAYNIFDPTSSIYNDPDFNAGGEQAIALKDAYVVDTIWVNGAYIQEKANLTNDKLEMYIVKSQAPDAQFRYFNLGQTGFPTIKADYYASTADTLLVAPTLNLDTVAVKAGGTAGVRTQIDYPLTAADTSSFLTYYRFVLPTPIMVNAGENLAFALKFISGDTYTKNVDTLNGMNRFGATFFEEEKSQLMKYRTGSAGGGDLSTSGLMFANDYSDIYPSILIEWFNTATFAREHLDCIWHAKSASAGSVAINGFSKTIANINVYPNPATDKAVFIADFVNNPKNVDLQIVNNMGQVITKKSLSSVNNSVKYIMDLTSVPTGVYTYTFFADGQSQSGKITVN
jgi:Secretion system C-terminal sorting domain